MARNVLFIIETVDLPLPILPIDKVTLQKDFDALVLKPVDGSSPGLMNKDWRCRLKLGEFVGVMDIDAVEAVVVRALLAQNGNASTA